MNKNTIVGDIGFFAGVIGFFIMITSALGFHPFLGRLNNAMIALALGILGLLLTIIQNKKSSDQVTRAGFIVNSAAIISGIIGLLVFFIMPK